MKLYNYTKILNKLKLYYIAHHKLDGTKITLIDKHANLNNHNSALNLNAESNFHHA